MEIINSIINMVEKGNSWLNGIVWGIPMLILIIGTGILMTARTGFFQVIRAKFVTNETFLAIFKKRNVTKNKDKKSISQFQALSTALAATIGTGNIAGVATAIAIGGPGAVFWMWVSAFFGMMTNFSENVLGIFYRRKNQKGEWSGGAMYYINDGLKEKKGLKHIAKPLAILFAVFCVLASFGIGNMTQINSIADAMRSNFGLSTLLVGIALAIIAAIVIVGGIKRIAQVTEKLVPFMALAYIVGAIVIFLVNYKNIPYVFGSIFSSAFKFNSIAGGVGGYVLARAITMGFKRGVFSNEAGLGSSVMVHSASNVKEPVIQGMWGIFEVFFDTIVVCTLTAFVLLSSSSNAISQDEAFSNITTKGQNFSIAQHIENAEDTVLIDSECNHVVKFADGGKLYNYDNPLPQYVEITTLDEVTGFVQDAQIVDANTSVKNPIAVTVNGLDGQIAGDTEILKGMPEAIEVTVYGEKYHVFVMNEADLTENEFTYTNIMNVKAVQATDENGNYRFTADNAPVIDHIITEPVEGVSLVTFAFSRHFGDIAGKFLAIAILLFAFSTVLGWSFYGTKSFEYLFGTRATIIYKVIFILFIVVGATMNLGLAWDIADTLNGLMAIPNLIGVIALSGVVVKITKNYTARKIKKSDPSLVPMLSAFDDIQNEQYEKMKQDGEI